MATRLAMNVGRASLAGCPGFLVALAALVGSSCSRQNDVSLAFSTVTYGASSGPHGFLCDVGNDLMAALAHDAAVDDGLPATEACVVTDIVTWGNRYLPGCRPGELIGFCIDNECTPELRATQTVSVPEEGTIAERVTQALESLGGTPAVLRDAPDVPLIVRTFATFQPCSELDADDSGAMPTPEVDLLFGCAHSCPVVLDDVTGELVLDLETLDPGCERSVRLCASHRFVEVE